MKVKVIYNNLQNLTEVAQKRLADSIHIEGDISDLELGKEHIVQAIANWEDGLRYYIHDSIDISEPRPWPAEFFSVVDGSIPKNWKICSQQDGIFQIGFSEWVEDKTFYERLIDEDPIALGIYKKNRL